MKDPHINFKEMVESLFKEMVESLIDEIKKEVESVFEPGPEKIRPKDINEQEKILQKICKNVQEHGGGLDTNAAAYIIENIIHSLKSSEKLDKWQLAYYMFTLGEFSMYLSINLGETDLPLNSIERYNSLMGQINRIKGHERKAIPIQPACKEAERRWLEWEKEGGPKIFHNKMAENLLEEMSELKEQKITKPMLLKELKEVAKKIDPSLIWGWNP